MTTENNDKPLVEERYVSPLVARLLEEKGFEGSCNTFYCENDTLIDSTLLGMCPEKCLPAPTQQMACDWVNTKGALITYDLAPIGTELMVKVYKKVSDSEFDWTEGTTIIRKTLEDSINAALEFSLKKLI